jgi:hypothetical protein
LFFNSLALIFFLFVHSLHAQNACTSCDSLAKYVKAGDTTRVRACLRAGADPNCEVVDYRTFDSTKSAYKMKQCFERRTRLLYLAVDAQNFQLVKLLVSAGASVQKGKWTGRDTLNFGYDRITFYAPIDLANDQIEKNKRTDHHILDFLIEHGALTSRIQERNGSRFYELIKKVRQRPDSIIALNNMIVQLGDKMEFILGSYDDVEGVDYVLKPALENNILSAVKYLVEVHHANLKGVHVRHFMYLRTNSSKPRVIWAPPNRSSEMVFSETLFSPLTTALKSMYLNTDLLNYFVSQGAYSWKELSLKAYRKMTNHHRHKAYIKCNARLIKKTKQQQSPVLHKRIRMLEKRSLNKQKTM